MKKLAIILFLFLFLLQCGIKTIIVVGFYAQRDIISRTLCENKNKPKMHCNGKCYLNKQLKKEQKNEQDLASILKNTSEIFVQNHTEGLAFVYFHLIVHKYDNYFIKPYYCITTDVFRPPLILS